MGKLRIYGAIFGLCLLPWVARAVPASPTNLSTNYFYDSADNVKRTVKQIPNGPGLATMMDYDSLNRLVKRTIQREDSATHIEDVSTFTYEEQLDNPNIIKTASNSVVTYTFEHESAPPFAPISFSVRATDPSNPFGIIEDTYSIQWNWGGITSVTNSAGQVIYSKTYDPAGRLLTVQSGSFSATLGYDGFGRRTSTSFSDGTSGTFAYDLINRVTDIQWTGAKPAEIHLQYDLAGNVSRVTRENGFYSMTYDNVDQLLSVTSQGSGSFIPYNRSFTYDLVGNRIGDSVNGPGTFVSNFLTQNSYASYTPDPDGTGAVCQVQTNSTKHARVVRQFAYRADESLNSFSDGTTRVEYAYDPYGRRVAKVVHQGGNTYTQSFTYLIGEDNVMLAKAGDGSITVYLHGQGPNIHLGEVKNGVGKGYTTDHIGSVLNGIVAGTANMFGFFGEVVAPPSLTASASPVMYGFAGMQFDAESGNYQSQGLRQYDASVGRWQQQEPTGEDGPNYYHYAFNNPLKNIDPTGLYTEVVIWQPVGWGSSSFGHVSTVINDISYSFGPRGWTVEPAADYIKRNAFREGSGVVLSLTPDQEKRLGQLLLSGDSKYSALGNNCGTGIQNALRDVGIFVGRRFFPADLGESLLNSPAANGTTYYPAAQAGNGWSSPWAK